MSDFQRLEKYLNYLCFFNTWAEIIKLNVNQ